MCATHCNACFFQGTPKIYKYGIGDNQGLGQNQVARSRPESRCGKELIRVRVRAHTKVESFDAHRLTRESMQTLGVCTQSVPKAVAVGSNQRDLWRAKMRAGRFFVQGATFQCMILTIHLRWGWEFFERTRILSGIQFTRYFIEFVVVETKRFVGSNVNVILTRQPCGQRSRMSAVLPERGRALALQLPCATRSSEFPSEDFCTLLYFGGYREVKVNE